MPGPGQRGAPSGAGAAGRRSDGRRGRGGRRARHGWPGRDAAPPAAAGCDDGPGGAGQQARPGLHPVGREDRAQRRVLVRIRPQVQEVPRRLTPRPAPPPMNCPHVLGSLLRVAAWAVVGADPGRRLHGASGSPRRVTATSSARPTRSSCSGAAQFNGTPGGVFEARLEHAVDLYKAGIAPYLVVTGGKLPGDRTTEAAAARKWAIAQGVPASAHPRREPGPQHARILEAVAAIFREHDLKSAVVRERRDAHAARPAHGVRPGHRRVGIAHPDEPDGPGRGPSAEGDAPRDGRPGRVLHRRRAPRSTTRRPPTPPDDTLRPMWNRPARVLPCTPDRRAGPTAGEGWGRMDISKLSAADKRDPVRRDRRDRRRRRRHRGSLGHRRDDRPAGRDRRGRRRAAAAAGADREAAGREVARRCSAAASPRPAGSASRC